MPTASFNPGNIAKGSGVICSYGGNSATSTIHCTGSGSWVAVVAITSWPNQGRLWVDMRVPTGNFEGSRFQALLDGKALTPGADPITLGPPLFVSDAGGSKIRLDRKLDEVANYWYSVVDQHTTLNHFVPTGWMCDYVGDGAWNGHLGLHPHKAACADHGSRRELVISCVFDVIIIFETAAATVDIIADAAMTIYAAGETTTLAAGEALTLDVEGSVAGDAIGYTAEFTENPETSQTFSLSHLVRDTDEELQAHSTTVYSPNPGEFTMQETISPDLPLEEHMHGLFTEARTAAGYSARDTMTTIYSNTEPTFRAGVHAAAV